MRKARARRAPKKVAFASLSTLAVLGVFALGITSLPSLLTGQGGAADSAVMSTAREGAHEGGIAEDSEAGNGNGAAKGASNRCGMPTVVAEPYPGGLALSVDFPDSPPADGEEIEGTVMLTNSGTTRVSGTTAIAPTIIVSRDGITVWHSDGAMIAMATHVILEPGETYTYDAYFSPVECGQEDETNGQFRSNLPPLTAGTYAINAELTFVPDAAGAGETVHVGGQATTITLR